MADRFIVNDTNHLMPSGLLEDIAQAWERSPKAPTEPVRILTKAGYEHARQQRLKEHLREKHRG